MEDSKSALDSFMNFKVESVSADVTAGGPSYLALIKSRYAVDATEKTVVKPQVSVAFEAWQEDFMNSNSLIPVDPSHSHCDHDHEHSHNIQENGNDVEDIEEDGMEQINLASSPQNTSTSASLMHMSNKLKVDNFYIDGESEALEELDLCGYMPSGVNNSALLDEASDSDDSAPVQPTDNDELVVEELNEHTDSAQHVEHIEDIEQAINALEHSTGTTPYPTHPTNTTNTTNITNMTLLQRAYQAEQRRVIETLSCSESDDELQHDHSHDTDDHSHTDAAPEPVNMAEALAEFQKFSARYRDIDNSELLQSIHAAGTSTGVDKNSNSNGNSDDHEVGSRWYDDVEEFVEEP